MAAAGPELKDPLLRVWGQALHAAVAWRSSLRPRWKRLTSHLRCRHLCAGLQLGEARTRLRAAVQGLDAARGREQPAPRPVPKCVPRAPAPAAGEEAGPGGSGGGCAPEEAVALDGRVLVLEEGVVAADAALEGAKAAHKAAALQLDGAEREQRAALSRLQLCGEERRGGHSSSLLPGLAGEVGAGLQAAYAKLWRRQLREGLADMRAVARLCASALRGIAQRSGDAVADLSGLQRLAQAAADPLIAAGRVAGRLFAGSVGSTTAAALMGGLGVLRLGVGVVKAGMQLMLFLALLYYLLAARADPLLAAAGMLPLSEAGRQRTAMALNRALGGGRALGAHGRGRVGGGGSGRELGQGCMLVVRASMPGAWLVPVPALVFLPTRCPAPVPGPPCPCRRAGEQHEAHRLPRLLLLDHLPGHEPAAHIHGTAHA